MFLSGTAEHRSSGLQMEMPDGFRFDSRPLCRGYFATLDVIDAMTLEAIILNCAPRSRAHGN
jgi:hypothetical protein